MGASLFSALWILPAYIAFTVAIGWLARGKRSQTAEEFLNAGRSLPMVVVVVAYLAANCGALELVGMTAMAAQYGVQAFHFYWIGAIPGMVFLSLFMMPVYRRSGVRSVPEYLLLRFGSKLRLLNAVATAIVLLLLSGISLYAMAEVLEVLLHISFFTGVVGCACVVLFYVLVGGIRATIYNEVLQLTVILAGLVPLAFVAGRRAMQMPMKGFGTQAHLWTSLRLFSPASSLDIVGVSVGLGFVLSFGYWCTDFVMMQRAFTARSEIAARQVPIYAGFGKLLFSLIVVLPGVAACFLLPQLGHGQRYDQALPSLMQRFYGPRLLAIGLTALAASLMSGLAANVSGFASIWTEDVYRAVLRSQESEKHYVFVGRIAVICSALASIALSYLNFLFTSIMEHVQLIFSVFGSPFWAVFLMGMSSRRADERGCVIGFLCGAVLSFIHSVLVMMGVLHYGSTMSANFYAAMYAFAVTMIVGLLTSRNGNSERAAGLVFRHQDWTLVESTPLLWTLAGTLLGVCVCLNILWR